MILNWVGYQYREYDGYGRFGVRMVRALQRAGVEVRPFIAEQLCAPEWIRSQMGYDPRHLTLSCLPPFYLAHAPGRHWTWTMTEGSEWPETWDDVILDCNVERIIVPSEYNARAVSDVLDLPVHVIHGGTSSGEFAPVPREPNGVYTFLALADRGARKGWVEAYEAFWQAFGSMEDTPDVRLLIKSQPKMNDMLETIRPGLDPRIRIWIERVESPRDMFSKCDCFVAPSRSEGWGMPHREAAMMGVPVITQQHAGLDDGNTHQWAYVVDGGQPEPIPEAFAHIKGQWLRCDVDGLAQKMRLVYDNPAIARERGQMARRWLADNQTWDHAAANLIDLFREVGVWH